MAPLLEAGLARITEALAEASEPWWIIGSAAVVLHGAETEVADIDLLLSVRDALALLEQPGCRRLRPEPSPLFRSALFARWDGAGLPIELMAGLEVSRDGAWVPVQPRTRVAVRAAGTALHVPDRAELGAILGLFGRPKDLARKALLEA